MVTGYGLGAISAPLAVGSAITIAPQQGLPLVLGLGCLAFLLFALQDGWRHRTSA